MLSCLLEIPITGKVRGVPASGARHIRILFAFSGPTERMLALDFAAADSSL